jgi:hypothetical protein
VAATTVVCCRPTTVATTLLPRLTHDKPTGYDWVVQYQKQMEHFVKQYIEISWTTVSSYVADQVFIIFRGTGRSLILIFVKS